VIRYFELDPRLKRFSFDGRDSNIESRVSLQSRTSFDNFNCRNLNISVKVSLYTSLTV
jgi:hypothetical protein